MIGEDTSSLVEDVWTTQLSSPAEAWCQELRESSLGCNEERDVSSEEADAARKRC